MLKQTDFNIYKIKNKEENVKKLLNEYNKINKIQTKIIKSLKNPQSQKQSQKKSKDLKKSIGMYDKLIQSTTKSFEQLSPTQNLLKNFMNEYIKLICWFKL